MSRLRLFASIFVPAALLYAATAAQHFVGGDHGIFAMVFAQGGYGHAPGYPLWSMLLQALGWLPFESAAHGSSIVAAVTGAAAVGIVGLAARDFTGSAPAAIVAAAIAGLSSHVWYMHTMAEVFALHHVAVALLLWSAAPAFPRPGLVRAVVAAAALAIGVAHHHTIIFFAPVFAFSFWQARSEGASVARLAAAFCVPLAGLAPYSFLTWSAAAQPDAFQWGDPSTFDGVVDLFLRRDFGTLSMTIGGESHSFAGRLGFFFSETASDLLFLPWFLAALAFVHGLRDPTRRARWIALLLALVLAGPLFALLLHRVPDGIDYLLVRKFHVTAQFTLALPAAVGAVELARRFEREHLLGIVGVIWAVIAASTAIGQLGELQNPAPEQYAFDLLSATPEDAVILGVGDHNFIGVEYLKAEGYRPDVTYVDATLLAHGWYVSWLESQVRLPHTGEQISLPNVVGIIGEQGRSVVYTRMFHESLQIGAIEPLAPALLLKPANERVGLMPLVQANGIRLEHLKIRPRPVPDWTWAYIVQQPYAEIWGQFADSFERAGMLEQANRARDQAKFFQPSPPRDSR